MPNFATTLAVMVPLCYCTSTTPMQGFQNADDPGLVSRIGATCINQWYVARTYCCCCIPGVSERNRIPGIYQVRHNIHDIVCLPVCLSVSSPIFVYLTVPLSILPCTCIRPSVAYQSVRLSRSCLCAFFLLSVCLPACDLRATDRPSSKSKGVWAPFASHRASRLAERA